MYVIRFIHHGSGWKHVVIYVRVVAVLLRQTSGPSTSSVEAIAEVAESPLVALAVMANNEPVEAPTVDSDAKSIGALAEDHKKGTFQAIASRRRCRSRRTGPFLQTWGMKVNVLSRDGIGPR